MSNPVEKGQRKFNEGMGTSAFDYSGGDNTATIIGNNVEWAEGDFGTALYFNGKDTYVSIPHISGLPAETDEVCF